MSFVTDCDYCGEISLCDNDEGGGKGCSSCLAAPPTTSCDYVCDCGCQVVIADDDNDFENWRDHDDPIDYEMERLMDEAWERENAPCGEYVRAIASTSRRARRKGDYYLTRGADTCDKPRRTNAQRVYGKALIAEGLEDLS